ncbi:MAG TPA: amidase [Myxococcota bacterium]|jgi:amidase
MADPLSLLDATAQAELVRRGELKPLELVDAAIARIEKLDSELGAVITRQFDRARASAAASDLPAGPFRGVPMLLKDLGAHLAGDPVHCGMRALKKAGWREPGESYFAERLRLAGLISLGRTNTPELGLLPTTEPDAYGPTRNPWKPTHSSGGSSGGSAAAVAAGLVAAAHASDGGGSIRIPASHCGLVGLKPSRGRASFGPGVGERWAGCSAEGFVTRSVRDTAALLDLVSGPRAGDPYSAAPPPRPFASEVGAAPGRLRIGAMLGAPRDVALAPECRDAVSAAARQLEALGHHVEEAHPAALDETEGVRGFVTLVMCATARALDAWSAKIGVPIAKGDVEPLTWALAELGRATSAVQYLTAIEANQAHARRVAGWWQRGFDLLLTPSCAAPPPPLGHFAGTAENPLAGYANAMPFGIFSSSWNLTGQPAISLPLHQSRDGLPIGVQLVADAGGEGVLLRVAAQLEQAVPWAGRLPPLHASHYSA